MTDDTTLLLRDMISSANCIPDISLGEDGDYVPEYVKSIDYPLSASADFTMECEIDGDRMAHLLGIDRASGKDFSIEYTCQPERIQVRRNKKRRINKKWAKRYGYNTVLKHISIKNCKVQYKNNMYEFEGV